MGSRNMRKLGGQFINGVSYMTGKGRAAASTIRSKTDSAQKARALSGVEVASRSYRQNTKYQLFK
jgi:hypothetical protein